MSWWRNLRLRSLSQKESGMTKIGTLKELGVKPIGVFDYMAVMT